MPAHPFYRYFVKKNGFSFILAWILANPVESHPEQRGHGSSRESRGERCEDRKGFPRWGKFLSFEGTIFYFLFFILK